MSGTQDNISPAENSETNESFNKVTQQESQAGSDENKQETEVLEQENLTPAQKMDKLLRKNTPAQLKKEIERLRKEASRYRKSSQEESAKKNELLKKTEEISSELETLRISNRNLKIMRALDKAGCLKSDLVAKDIPADCEDLEAFIEEYKDKNAFLFKMPKISVGSSFKSSVVKNLTPSQQMDAFIRAALGR